MRSLTVLLVVMGIVGACGSSDSRRICTGNVYTPAIPAGSACPNNDADLARICPQPCTRAGVKCDCGLAPGTDAGFVVTCQTNQCGP